MTDRELLGAYAHGSQEAFAELVDRHAGRVYATCMRLLGNAHSAEDATQAAFLVLARKAPGLDSATVLAGWLHAVARDVALNLLREESRRRRREKEAAAMRAGSQTSGAPAEALRAGLDAALAALPAAQRQVLLLRHCYGRTEAEVAAELGWSRSRISVTLSRAVEALRAKLSRRGVAVPAAAMGAALAAEAGAGAAALPAALLAALKGIGPAGAAAAGSASVSGTAASLAEGTMKAMMIAKVKLAAAVVGAVLAVGAGGGAVAAGLVAGEPAAPAVQAPAEAQAALPYKDDPAIIRRIDGIGDNTAIVLPPFRMAGEELDKWQATLYPCGPMLRSFGMKLVYASDRGTAFYCGGAHNVPHKTTDMWELHVGSNTWNLVFPPDGGNHREKGHIYAPTDPEWIKANVVFRDGYLQTTRGGCIMPSHEWDGITYDPVTRQVLWVAMTWGGPLGMPEALSEYAKITGQNLEALKKQEKPLSGIWIFDTQTRKWSAQPLLPGSPRFDLAGSLNYIPEIRKSLWHINHYQEERSGTWTFDSAAGRWEKLAVKHGKTIDGSYAMGMEGLLAYSPRHRKCVGISGKSTFVFDIDKNEWSQVSVDEKLKSDAHDASSVFVYDSANDVFLLIYNGLHAFSLTTMKWEDLAHAGAPLPKPGPGYYDPRLNAMVVYPSDDAKSLWLYRYGKSGGKK